MSIVEVRAFGLLRGWGDARSAEEGWTCSITAGIWAFGLMVLTVAVKVALPVLSGKIAASHATPGETGHGDEATEAEQAA